MSAEQLDVSVSVARMGPACPSNATQGRELSPGTLCWVMQPEACKTCRKVMDLTGNNQCETCNPGYGLTEALRCEAFACEEGAGEKCASCRGDRTADGQCKTCNPGYELGSDLKCVAVPCDEGGSSTDCKVCAAQEDRQVVNQCVECNTGAGLVGPFCQHLTCETGPGAACKTCVAERTDFNECASCNAGYQLKGKTCEAIPCTLGAGEACKTCRPQEARIAEDECESCNPGYFLSDASGRLTCEAYSCSIGLDEACKTCQEQGNRTGGDQCKACNPGRGPGMPKWSEPRFRATVRWEVHRLHLQHRRGE